MRYRKRILHVAALLSILTLGFSGTPSFAEEEKTNTLTYTAEITWNTDLPCTSQVEYGTQEGVYPQKTPLNGGLVTAHAVLLRNLASGTLYHYRVRSKDPSGNEVIGKDTTLLISDGKTQAPIEISDVKASNISAVGVFALGPATPVTKDEAEERALFQARGPVSRQAEQEPVSGSMVSKEEPIERALIEKGGLLLPKNKLQIEPSYMYAHISANKIAVQGLAILPILVIGEISTERVKRDIFIAAAAVRYGILNNLQWNVKVPYRFQYNRTSNTSREEFTRTSSGIGDIETGLSYQFCSEHGGIPGLIGGINVKSHTGSSPYGRDISLGTGHWALTPSLVWVKSSDPAILFGSLAYTCNIERTIEGFGSVDPGDTYAYSLGFAFALNYQTALNFQIEQQITNRMRMNGSPVPGSFTNVANFKTGFTYSISKNLSLDVVTGLGLSEDAPDFTLEIRFPYTF